METRFSGSDSSDCEIRSGEYPSTRKKYLKNTDTAEKCVQEVKTNEPQADAMTWVIPLKNCNAKFGSSNSSLDPDGCDQCMSCFFGKIKSFQWELIVLILNCFYHIPFKRGNLVVHPIWKQTEMGYRAQLC